jgi:6-pyruvoyltetrahydropterin/6-carboxytetrahydropterin synthase
VLPFLPGKEWTVYELTVETTFSAAHRIVGHPGPCARLHGHNYRAVVTVSGDELGEHGMLIDFGRLKEICQEVLAPLDHSFLNELPPFADVNPTAEAIARHIHQMVAEKLAEEKQAGVRVARVTVHESDRSCATYRE